MTDAYYKYTPEQIRAKHYKSVTMTLSPKYISIESQENWRGQYFSRTGWCAHASSDASPRWIGENFRKALMTSEYFNKPELLSLDRDQINAMKAVSNERVLAFNDDIMRTYGYKKLEQIGLRCDVVFAWWYYLVEDSVNLIATKRRAGGHSAWGRMEKKFYNRKRLSVPLSLPDETLGLAIRDAFSRCEAPGRQKINAPADWGTPPDEPPRWPPIPGQIDKL